MRACKHVLCEKPLTITVNEARALRDLAARHKVATSLGNQGTQSGPFRRGLELIRDGAILSMPSARTTRCPGLREESVRFLLFSANGIG